MGIPASWRSETIAGHRHQHHYRHTVSDFRDCGDARDGQNRISLTLEGMRIPQVD